MSRSITSPASTGPSPALLLSGEKSYPFLGLVDEELERLLPAGRRIVLCGATHRMWYEQPAACRQAVLDFLRASEARRTAAPGAADWHPAPGRSPVSAQNRPSALAR
jgi:hypothetical protein